jgi:hypothetical protein
LVQVFLSFKLTSGFFRTEFSPSFGEPVPFFTGVGEAEGRQIIMYFILKLFTIQILSFFDCLKFFKGSWSVGTQTRDEGKKIRKKINVEKYISSVH